MSAQSQFSARVRKSAGPLLACTAVAAVAAPAFAIADPTIQADRPCYVPGQQQHLTGSGYEPNKEVTLSYNQSGPHGNGTRTGTTTADGAGNINAFFKTPDLASSDDTQETVNLGAFSTDLAQGPTAPPLGTTQFRTSILDALVPAWESRKGSPRRMTTFYGWGFEAVGGKTLYAHYVLRGKLRKTVAIGRLSGPCGDVKKRGRQFPFRPVRAGDYKVKLDATKRYPNKSPGYTYKHVKVRRAVR
jgi:hypothetical protein